MGNTTTSTISLLEQGSGDVNGDSHVDISDVIALVNIILNGSDGGIRSVVTNIGCSYDGGKLVSRESGECHHTWI